MDTGRTHPDDQRALIRELVGEIEAIRIKRRDSLAGQVHPEGKRFTQEELNNYYPNYKNLLLGRTQRLPSRTIILQIADYLECTIHETDDLLLAAQYLPESVGLREDEERKVIEAMRTLLHTLPLPGFLICHGGHIDDINHAILRLFQLPTISSIPLHLRDGVHWFFNQTLPSHRIHAADRDIWHRNAQNMAALFQHLHRSYRRESWFRTKLASWYELPEFSRYWEACNNRQSRATLVTNETTALYPHLGPAPVLEANVVVAPHATNFPCLIISVPLNDAARQVYHAAGCYTAENRWEETLNLQITGVL
jgi:PAS domain-containing protein